ncbi:MAG TPA: patatin-like phospholipase family protein [Rhodopila sp.]|nr:patatin-like phospholipase family protein [Rhodopila sp.]
MSLIGVRIMQNVVTAGASCILTRWRAAGQALLAAFILMFTGCALPTRLPAVPQNETTLAQIPGIPNARFFPDTQTDLIAREAFAARQREAATLARAGYHGPLPETNILAVSGGGANGAFGAGLLNGWTEAGTRPEFKLVTGVSTGALTAPFAFLGPAWDAALTAVYTGIKPTDVFRTRGFTAAIWNDAMSDTSPLFRLISRYANQDMLAAIARAYASGRLLMIGSTDLDARRPVIWNIGAIAASGQPNALDLFRKILLASAAIPAVFPPVLIDVEVNGRHYQEMHVDGGAIAQMFLYPPALAQAEIMRTSSPRPVRAWLIRNSRLDPDWATVERRTMGIAQEAIATMIHASGLNDVNRIYLTTLRDHVDFNLAYIGRDFTVEPKESFDPVFMQALYDYGRAEARAGYPWAKRPPWAPAGEVVFTAAPVQRAPGVRAPAH